MPPPTTRTSKSSSARRRSASARSNVIAGQAIGPNPALRTVRDRGPGTPSGTRTRATGAPRRSPSSRYKRDRAGALRQHVEQHAREAERARFVHRCRPRAAGRGRAARYGGRTHSRFISQTPSPSGVTPTQPASASSTVATTNAPPLCEEPAREVVPVGDVREDRLEVRRFAGPACSSAVATTYSRTIARPSSTSAGSVLQPSQRDRRRAFRSLLPASRRRGPRAVRRRPTRACRRHVRRLRSPTR